MLVDNPPPLDKVVRYQRFTLSLAARDRRCCVTRSPEVDQWEGAHVIPHSWKKHRYEGLLG